MIILNAAEADQVRGLTVLMHALAPRPLKDGTFALPEAVLSDPYHSVHRDFLSTLDIRLDSSIRTGTQLDPNDPASPIINSDWSDDPETLAASTYQSDWAVGELKSAPASRGT